MKKNQSEKQSISKSKKRSGQATIETALALPFLIWLLYYTLNAFQYIHTHHVGQKFAAMNMYERLANRAKFSVDAKADQVHSSDFIAVRYTDPEGNPTRRNILDSGNNTTVNTVIGICKEPSCQ